MSRTRLTGTGAGPRAKAGSRGGGAGAEPAVYDRSSDLPAGLPASCRAMPLPDKLLMCPPDYFEVRDVKNPHMEGNIGKVDRALALRQWKTVRAAFLKARAAVDLIAPTPDCEDMVFCANQTLAGLDAGGRKTCLLSRMKHVSRRREVEAFGKWIERAGYRLETLPEGIGFEGSGDALWHPGRGLLWGGCGFRSDPTAYVRISEIFGVPVLRLTLHSDRFYHLDTCLCPIDERTALVHAGALSKDGLGLVRAAFERVIECDDREAVEGMACNATAIGGKAVVIQKGNPRTVRALRDFGYEILEVDTSEYLKSGGSVFCMKMYVF